jgi:hypothetical protein
MALPTTVGPGGSASYGISTGESTGAQQSSSFIPSYSETPILENIANYAQQMAPQVYQWGMNAYNQNQGNINQMLRQGQQWASPQQIAAAMGSAESGVMQAGEQQRQAALQDLQSYGIDPSSGRYASLDQANRVQMAASAAGAGNQARQATLEYGNALTNQGIQASLANVQTGYGASNAMNQLLGTGMSLKYSPLGTASSGYNQSTNQSLNQSYSAGQYGAGGAGSGYWMRQSGAQAGGPGVAKGGYISPALSASHGEEVDDVSARLNAGEYVIPRDVVDFKGKEFFSKLIAQARKASGGGDRSTDGQRPMGRGLNLGGAI